MFAYWGALGALPKLTLDLANVAAAQDRIRCTFCLSPSNELFEQYQLPYNDVLAIPTFENKRDPIRQLKSIIDLRSRVKKRFSGDNTQAFVSLMSHIWSPLIAPVIRKAGVRHVVIVHDADHHPGDPYALANLWLLREAAMADHVITLSKFVAQRLTTARGIPERKISVLFHPDLSYGVPGVLPINKHAPLRILFIGRILPYKGLDLLVDAVESLRRDRLPLELGIFGRGKIEPSLLRRLSKLGAEVVNRWSSHKEFGDVLSLYDVVIAAHTEASQSGIIAAAFGAGVPVIATPVGGLTEQVTSGVTGIVAESATAHALADAIRALAESRSLLAQFRQGIAATRGERSMQRFFDEICRIALRLPA